MPEPDVSKLIGVPEAISILDGIPVTPRVVRVPVAETERAGNVVKILRPGNYARYVAARGSDCPAGKVVLQRGAMIGPAQIAVAATVGAAELEVFDPPHVAVLGTGDELVPYDVT